MGFLFKAKGDVSHSFKLLPFYHGAKVLPLPQVHSILWHFVLVFFNVFLFNPEGEASRSLYEEGVRWGSLSMALYSASCSAYSLVIKRLVDKLGTILGFVLLKLVLLKSTWEYLLKSNNLI